MYIRSGRKPTREMAAERMREYSWRILEEMGDQLGNSNVDAECANGRSISIEKAWDPEDRSGWPDVSDWIIDQYARLKSIAAA